MPQKLIIDADPGIGDALAIAVALVDPGLDVIALTGVGGCVSSMQSGRNLQAIIEALDPPKWPRIGVGCRGLQLPDAEESKLFQARSQAPEWQQHLRKSQRCRGVGRMAACCRGSAPYT